MSGNRRAEFFGFIMSIFAFLMLVASCGGSEDDYNGPPTGIPYEPILLPVPNVRQANGYFCGVASFEAVMAYYGIDISQDLAATLLGTTEEGTDVENIMAAFRAKGLEVAYRENATIDEVEQYLSVGSPVIVAYQAWTDLPSPVDWADDWEDGHYSVVIGVDRRANRIYLMDPSLIGTTGYMDINEFMLRWHDYKGEAPYRPGYKVYNHLAVAIKGRLIVQQRFTHID